MALLRTVLVGVVLVFLVGCGRPLMDGPALAAAQAAPPVTQEPAPWPVAPAEPTPDTIVTPFLEHPIRPGENVLWCATFQMAWDRLKELNGGPLETTPGSATVTMLNRGAVARGDIPQSGALSAAGLVADGVIERLRAELERMPGGNQAVLLPDRAALPDDAVITYAFLARALPFATPLATMRDGHFADSDRLVRYFGIDTYDPADEHHRAQAEQVRVLWHQFRVEADGESGDEFIAGEDFILELLTTSPDDRLVLAKVPPAETLAATVSQVLERMRTPNTKVAPDGITPEWSRVYQMPAPETAEAAEQQDAAFRQAELAMSPYANLLNGESLRIPQIVFDVTKVYDELVGQTVVAGAAALRGKPIWDARQRIRFRLDERGAELLSEAAVAYGGSLPARDFSFHEPFLVMLLRRGAERPYFAVWLANPGLLMPAGEPAEEEERD